MNEASPGSLHAFLVSYAGESKDIISLTRLLETLSPGGTGILHLAKSSWSKSHFEKICKGAGLRVLMFTKKTKMFRTSYYVVVRKSLPSEVSQFTLSIILADPSDEEQSRASSLYFPFLIENGLADRSEIVIVEDSPPIVEGTVIEDQKEVSGPDFKLIYHYKSSGKSASILTGLYHARGRYILLDESFGLVQPYEIFSLLNVCMKYEQTDGIRPGAIKGVAGGVTQFTIFTGAAVRELAAQKQFNNNSYRLLEKKGFLIDSIEVTTLH